MNKWAKLLSIGDLRYSLSYLTGEIDRAPGNLWEIGAIVPIKKPGLSEKIYFLC